MKNLFKQKVAQEPLYGLWLALADQYSAEICAGAGFDFLLLDGEHSPIDLRTILGSFRRLPLTMSRPSCGRRRTTAC